MPLPESLPRLQDRGLWLCDKFFPLSRAGEDQGGGEAETRSPDEGVLAEKRTLPNFWKYLSRICFISFVLGLISIGALAV
jgi:hypothetical protein